MALGWAVGAGMRRPARRREFPPSLSCRRVRLWTSVLALLVALVLSVTTANAQTTAVCSDTPASGERIECTGDSTSTDDIDIDARGVDIDTSAADEPAIKASHAGNADVNIRVRQKADNLGQVTQSDIDTSGAGSHGIWASHTGTGNVDITVQSTDITTSGDRSRGIVAQNQGPGNITITAIDNTITTTDNTMSFSDGIHGYNAISYDQDNNPIEVPGGNMVTIDVQGGSIMTAATQSHGVYGWLQNTGDIDIDFRGVALTTKGSLSFGIYGRHQGGAGDVSLDVRGGSITTMGLYSAGIDGRHQGGAGDIDIDVYNLTITTESTEIDGNGLTAAYGIVGFKQPGSTGDIFIDAHAGVDITTKGAYSYGLYGLHQGGAGGDNIHIATDADSSVITTGPNGHGIVAYNLGTEDSRSIDITVGGSVATSGAGAQGVRVGTLSNSGAPERVAAIGEDGYRQQIVTVNGPVTSTAEGVYMAGGGRVVIGPRGSIASESGIAILATGTVPAVEDDPVTMDIDEAMPAIPPKLRVDLNLGGRRVAQAIGDDWILNDEGETTIAVNGTVLHDGATGVTNRTATNGAWNVRMRAEGVTVPDRTDPDPANWTVSAPASGVIADRDFSAQDFNEARRPTPRPQTPLPPPSCPESQVGTPPNCTEPDPETPMDPKQPMFDEEYAPRAALYEALPDFLLRLTGPGPNRHCRSAPEERAWVRFAGGQGSYAADRSTTGATYDLDRFETEGGFSAAFTDTARGWGSVRHIWATASVGSPTGGGTIDVRGLGSSVGGTWQSPTGAYALGCFAYMGYNVDFASSQRGLLKAGTNGLAYTLDFEAGQRFVLTEQVQLTPRVWVVGSRVTVDRFTDVVDARVSYADADRVLGGLGIVADTLQPWGDGQITLRGSVDYERIVSGATTTTTISGERLRAEATDNSLLVGLQGLYRQGRFSIGAEIAARQELGSDDSEYASFVNLGVRF